MQLTASILFGWILGAVAHETGHFLVAKFTGTTVVRLVFGNGPRLGQLKLGTLPITIRLLPFGGFVQILPFLQVHKFKQLLFLSGGIIGNLILLTCFTLIDWSKFIPGASLRVEFGLAFSQLCFIIYNLWPKTLFFDEGQINSDGRQILAVLKLRSNGLTAHGQFYRDSLKSYTQQGDSEVEFSVSSQRLLHYASQLNSYHGEEQNRLGQLRLIKEIGSGTISPPEELRALDVLTTHVLQTAAQESLVYLDEWSSRAMALGSDFNAIRHTRGAVLVELGRYDEAKEIIVPAMRETDSEFETMLNCIFLARAEHALGNTVAAQNYAEKAHKLAATDAAQYGSGGAGDLLLRMDAAISIS